MGEYKLFFSVRNSSKWTNCNMEAADRKSRKVETSRPSEQLFIRLPSPDPSLNFLREPGPLHQNTTGEMWEVIKRQYVKKQTSGRLLLRHHGTLSPEFLFRGKVCPPRAGRRANWAIGSSSTE